ncbi:ORC-CDC6 family AAA ATPase [Mesorhizobium sp. LjNodule214]|uniref:ORC-CDC6 family AAA ATPase n=1 Tax=Mesorhizobium sp. LjNodule214 TaxID=3342252 RepID=UPI003ECE2CFE
MNDKITQIHTAFLGFAKRAEKVSSDILSHTFVDTEPLTTILGTSNNQILYGRRGTGKTHALLYLAESVRGQGESTIYLDLRSIGSDGSIYNDLSRSLAERSVRLVLDVLKAIGNELYGIAVERIASSDHPDQITVRLDDLESSFSEVRIVGDTTAEEKQTSTSSASKSFAGSLVGVLSTVTGTISASSSVSAGEERQTERTTSGREQFSLHFGRVQSALRSLLEVLGNPRIWVLIDEWSEIPIDLQPLLADLLRRTLLPIDNFIVKIAAIEHRSSFFLPKGRGEYVGFELGADISTDLNLDDFLVFDNDQGKSVDFFKRLLFRHLKASEAGPEFTSPEEMVQIAFTQAPAFDELVRAAEGVPRDALNLAAKVATKSFGKAVSITDVRAAARDWYQQDKAASVQASTQLYKALEYIIGEVIGNRRARAFLLKANTRNEVIDRLFDYRVIHLLKKNISSHDDPGQRYDAFKIDYGCYVELINTQKATEGLFAIDDGGHTDVPLDDYRSIRRAILNVEELPS